MKSAISALRLPQQPNNRMNSSHGLSDSPPSRNEPRQECEKCGTKTLLNNGLCVNCLLGEGLEPDAQASTEEFESVLGEADVPDKHWRMGNYEILEEIAHHAEAHPEWLEISGG